MENSLMTTMDDYCAPQWIDLQSSPNVPSEDFFQREHLEHERQMDRKLNKDDIFPSTSFDFSDADPSIGNQLSLQTVPVKIVSPSQHNKTEVQETTYTDVLCDAMKQLQLSAKIKRMHVSSTPSVNVAKELFKTPVAPTPVQSFVNPQLNISSIKCKQNRKSYTVQGRNRTSTPKVRYSEINNTSVQPTSISQPNFNTTPRKSARKDNRTNNKKTPKIVRRVELNDVSIQSEKNVSMQNISKTMADDTNNENIHETDSNACNKELRLPIPQIVVTEETLRKSLQKNDDKNLSKQMSDEKNTSVRKNSDKNILREKNGNSTSIKTIQKNNDKNISMQKDNKNLSLQQDDNRNTSIHRDNDKITSTEKVDVNSSLKVNIESVMNVDNTEYNELGVQKDNKDNKGVNKDTIVHISNEDSFITIVSENSQNKEQEVDDTLKKDLRSKVAMSKQRKSIVSKARRSFGNQFNRRRSLSKSMKPVSCQSEYVSLAEAVSKFQKETPKRFRSVNDEHLPPAITKIKQAAKSTIPISPVLATKSRARPTTILSTEEQQILEMENMKKHQIKANPVRVLALKGPVALKKKVSKKPKTVPEPFHLSGTKRSTTVPEQSHLSETKKPPNVSAMSREPHSKEISHKKSVSALVNTNDSAIVVEKQEVLFFGVPAKSNPKKKTVTVPFSFENRHKEWQNKKEKKLQQLQTEKDQNKSEFHARPVPKYSKSAGQTKEQVTKKSNIVPCPFSFEQRDKLRLERKEQHAKETVEKDKKVHEFHANPAPPMKPVPVQNTSKNVLKAKSRTVNKEEKHEPPKKILPKQNKCQEMTKCISTKSNAKTDENKMQHKCMSRSLEQENINPNIVQDEFSRSDGTINKTRDTNTKLQNIELNTDKRAKVRRDFDEKLKQKEHERELMRQKEAEYRLAKEKAERAELRKMAEIKANPMPVFKPISIMKSTKPLTNPQSPAWGRKSKSTTNKCESGERQINQK